MEEKISDSVMLLITTKKMWNTLKMMYENEKNPSMVFEIYKCMFELKQGDRSVPEFYEELRSLIDEFKIHQSVVTHAAT